MTTGEAFDWVGARSFRALSRARGLNHITSVGKANYHGVQPQRERRPTATSSSPAYRVPSRSSRKAKWPGMWPGVAIQRREPNSVPSSMRCVTDVVIPGKPPRIFAGGSPGRSDLSAGRVSRGSERSLAATTTSGRSPASSSTEPTWSTWACVSRMRRIGGQEIGRQRECSLRRPRSWCR